ncbi:molybdopterin oxidoreductase [Leptospira yanagawae serovar Saopaulo str. Sao Paulo = ATCC 700523]|uniref:nitrate reductase (cytochrome) n=1 Tax=Leptospira yanagawae serovar Saopaulo str. Sao Paulo = ATCC 700523 TaxID=1249483 RepID=A0A5E8HBT0_9LEPT|nr:nitrate reductase [Leptospira yanagawae]EOQ88699.1 molybdopterin oxidoreductase [Leptospira yanagawae serovar Saopaulo str. Sao Paulo = ATCC 700523]
MQNKETYPSTCSYCGVGCGVTIQKLGNHEIRVEGDKDHPANLGLLCSKGRNLHYTVMDRSDRILYPLHRATRTSNLKRITWNQALDSISEKFKNLLDTYGPDSVGFYVSGQLLTEEYYIINKLIKGFIGSNNIDTNSRLCMSSAVVGYKMALGEDSVPVSYEDIELADCFLIAGANPAWCHPIIFRRIEAQKKNFPNTKLIVVDPRKTDTCEEADLHLQIHPGTDIYLFHAIAKVLIDHDWIDHNFLTSHTEGFDELKTFLLGFDLQKAANICGVPLEDIALAAKYIHEAKGFLSLWAMGLNQSVIGVNKNLALINLSLITGKIGKPGSGPFSLTGQPNAMGGREVGGLCNLLPAHRDLNQADHRREVELFWGVSEGKIKDKPGFTAVEMFENLKSGKMKAVWIVCTNPTTSLPDARTVEQGLREAELVVVQDISMSNASIPYADYVLPAAGWAEKQGTMTNSDRRVTYLSKIIDPPGEAISDTFIIQKFAEKMGYGSSFAYQSEEDVFLEHAALTKGTNIDISGLDYSILQEKRSVQWPFPENSKEGTPRLFTDHKFYRPNGKAKIFDVKPDDVSEKTSERYPFILTTGRIRDQWHTMTRTGKVRKLMEHKSEPYLEIHPKDSASIGIEDETLVEVFNERGLVRVKAKVTDSIKQGTVFLPMHWGKKNQNDEFRANNLTNKEFDPFSKQPGFKISAVQIRTFQKEKEKILIIGGGNSTSAFIKHYKELCPDDEITVLCKEENPLYNRILLPDFISGEKLFTELTSVSADEVKSWDIQLHTSTSVTTILPEAKIVKDSLGNSYSYHKLIIATGSSPQIPKSISPNMVGVFSLRAKTDADKIKGFFVPDSHALIVGGGLLGLELASALKSLGVKVTVLVRTNRLMSKQLDSIACEILREEIESRGIEVSFNSEISKVHGYDRVTYVELKDGKKIYPDGIVYAMGTSPNLSLAKEMGIEIGEGIKVNEFLQTSDPDIYAIGEVAEHTSGVYGTVLAAEEQAKVAANHIYGYRFQTYKGSLHSNLLKIPGLELVSLRLPGIQFEDLSDEYEEIVFMDRKRRKYKKCIVKGDKLVGAILVGDKSEFVEYKNLIASGLELGDKRQQLLSSISTAKPPKGVLVCSCNGVGQGNIEDVIQFGAKDLNEVMEKTGAGTGCGSCRPEVSQIIKRCLSSH